MSRDTADLEGRLRIDGWLIAACYVLLVPLSFAIAAVSPYGVHQRDEAAAFAAIADAPWARALSLTPWLSRVLDGNSVFASVGIRTAIVMALLLIATAAALHASVLLAKSRALVEASTCRLIVRVAGWLAVANVCVYPMFTQDMWMSVVWGRMLLAGHNPYYEWFTASALAGTPQVNFQIKMTYGPLWAWVSAGLAALSGGSAVGAYIVAKVFLALCWLAALWLIRALLSDKPLWCQASALCFFGWWPATVHYAVGEGHNDIVLVTLVLLWMFLTLRRPSLGSVLALVASILVKYISAPLVAIELWRGVVERRRGRGAYLVAAGAAFAAGAVVFATLWRDSTFFTPVLDMQDWAFFTPAQAVSTVLRRIGIDVGVGTTMLLARLVFSAVVVVTGARYATTPSRDTLVRLVLALMSAAVFAGVGHVWPWFVVWSIAPAAVAGAGTLWRMAVATALVAPLMEAFWLGSRGWSSLPLGGVLFFGAIALIAIAPIGWRSFEWGGDTAMNAMPDARPDTVS